MTWAEPEAAVVNLQALGGFRLSVGGRLVPEQDGKAIKTKLLLKTGFLMGTVAGVEAGQRRSRICEALSKRPLV